MRKRNKPIPPLETRRARAQKSKEPALAEEIKKNLGHD